MNYGGFPASSATMLSHTPTWPFVRRRFQRLLDNLQLLPDQRVDGETKHRGVSACLNRAYWNVNDETVHCRLAGSWGKGTPVRPPRDIDLLFQLPSSVYQRFQNRSGNRQSQVLQELKDVLPDAYPTTRMRGDGQIVVVPFNTYAIEVAPAFARQGGGYFICDTNDGGRYKWVDPGAELAALDESDRLQNGNVRKLAQIIKRWQHYCDAPIKSFQIEALVKEALPTLSYGGSDEYWFDWLVRDVLAHMIGRPNGFYTMPVTGEVILLGDQWLSKAQTAHGRALKACSYEHYDCEQAAGEEWQKIFGTMIPLTVT
jgi:hypothetical protein